jgi:hypothetical protein
MNSKKKTILAITVKLLFAFVSAQAQNKADSTKQKPVVFLPLYNNQLIMKQPATPNQLPGNFYARQLPFFCGKELRVEKTVGIPIKFRLSTVEYCDRLEGKNR